MNSVSPSTTPNTTAIWRLATIRGRVVAVTAEGADALIDQLAGKYLGAEAYPFRQPGEVRLTPKIAPERVSSRPRVLGGPFGRGCRPRRS